MLMPHGRAERELKINRGRCRERDRFNRGENSKIDNVLRKRAPKISRDERDDDKQTEESLRDAGVKNSDLILEHRDAQPAENSLQNHTADRDQTESANPLSIFCALPNSVILPLSVNVGGIRSLLSLSNWLRVPATRNWLGASPSLPVTAASS